MPVRNDDDLDLLAFLGELNRHNTEVGSRERKAVYRKEYQRRVERGTDKGLTPAQSVGHAAPGDVPPTISLYVDGPPRLIVLEDVSRSDARRAGIYMGSGGSLLDVKGTDAWETRAKAFERRFSQWRPIAGFTIVSDPETILALEESRRAEDREIKFDSGRAEPGPRRRQAGRGNPHNRLKTEPSSKQTRRGRVR